MKFFVNLFELQKKNALVTNAKNLLFTRGNLKLVKL
jgi:hypothetical protein